MNGEEKDFVSELSCEARAIEEIITPVARCPKNFKSVEFGYTNPIKQVSKRFTCFIVLFQRDGRWKEELYPTKSISDGS